MPKNHGRFPSFPTPVVALSVAYGVLLLSWGAHMPFFPLWLAASGLDPAEIGILLALPLIQRVLTVAWASAFASRLGNLKWGLALFSVLSFCIVLLYLRPGGFAWIAVVTVVLALVWMPQMPVLDALTVARARVDGFEYGAVRAWGSVAFIVAALFGGVMIERFGVGSLVPFLALCFAASALVALGLPKDPGEGSDAKRPGLAEGVRLLFAQPGLAPILVGCGLVQASHALVYGFGSVHWKGLGHSETMIGFAWAIGIFAEIGLLFVSGRLVARFGLGPFMAVGCGAAVLRWAVLSFDPDLPLLLAAQALHGLSFAATHVATVNLLGAALPVHFGALAQGTYSSLLGALNGAAFLAAGPLYAALQGRGFAVMAGLALAAGGLIAYGVRQHAAVKLSPRARAATDAPASRHR